MLRSERRHHQARIKAKRWFHWGRDLRDDLRALGMAAITPAPCSCWMCSTQTERSVKERSADEAWRKIEQA
jgi:hypothetical protein